ncbi:MAG: FtsK/SpoIIIE domain-containing protein [Actinomycetota bacterium]
MAAINRIRSRRRTRDATSETAGLVVGRRVSGEQLILPRPSGDPLHALVSGTTGAGKTVFLWAWIGGLAGLDDVALVGMDPKRTGLSPWAPRFTTVAKSVTECSRLAVALWEEVDRRLDVMDNLGAVEWRTEFGGPFIVVVGDELVEIASLDGSRITDVFSAEALTAGLDEISAKDRAERVNDLGREMRGAKTSREAQGMFLASLARMCRSAGVMIIGATQYPMSTVIDPQFRSNMGIRVMLRVPSDEMIPVCLGQGQHQDVTSDSISVEERGGLWVTGLYSARPIRARGLYVTIDDVTDRANATAHLRWTAERVFPTQEPPDPTPAGMPVPGLSPDDNGSALPSPVGTGVLLGGGG